MKKNYLNFILPIICLTCILGGCTDEYDVTEAGNTYLKWDRSCRVYTLPINTTQVKQIKIDGEWIMTCNENAPNTPLKIYIEENSDNEARNGIIRIMNQEGKWHEIQIQQQGRYINEGVPDSYERTMGVGWGYDCNSYYGDPRGVKDQIFNPIKIKRLNNKYPGENLINDEIYSFISSFVCTGSSSTEFSNNLAVEADIHVGIPYAFSLDVQAKFSNSELSTGDNYFTTKRYKSIIKKRSLEIENLMAYVAKGEDIYTYGFKRYLQRLKDSGGDLSVIRDFVSVYGNSTVYVGDIGGRVDYNMTVQKSRTIKKEDVEVGVTVGLFSLFSMSVSKKQQETYDKICENSKFNLSAKGGDVTLLGKAVLNNEQCSEETLTQWAESIQEENAELIDCQLKPIWELIEDEIIRNRVKAYITGQRIQEENLTFPEPTSLPVKIPVPSFDKNGTQIKVGWAAGAPVAEFCNELIPIIDPQERVIVAYPIINNKPNYQKGIFVGNGGRFAPGEIVWTGDQCSYQTLNNFNQSDILSYVYIHNFSINATSINEKTYLDGINKDTYIEYYNEKYPIIKIDTIVWFRNNLHSTKLTNGLDIQEQIKYKDNTYYYPSNWENISKLAPINWEIPNKSHINSINNLVHTSNAHLEGGTSGLDIKPSGGYGTNNIYQEGYFILLNDGQCMEFVMLSPIEPNNTIKKAPVRPVRSYTFHYK